ncbi:hypothetical protein EYZ11_007017 [Aspergillus tanneri]|uniref:Uncharacterized protein n=1 Tax=Aspergillus tanneri TaxID=1220188 RepID=A0A4S3JE02_9EURO|nr:hypothetical protein EYZ11_007017 [Aspergillus tanneri]
MVRQAARVTEKKRKDNQCGVNRMLTAQ